MNHSCNCQTWARDFSFEDSRFPYSNHHPWCEHFKQKKYIKLYDDDGHKFILDEDTARFVAKQDPDYKMEELLLTEDQFERMKEYQGL